MKRFRIKETCPSNLSSEGDDESLSLLAVSDCTDWYDNEFDQISELKVGEAIYFGSLRVERVS